ncbi:hypothetical protein [Paenibacillus sp. 32O-W]|uniref:hypothetical protein n=1 Tax=Paenibacillus sp. 32O-W TaxID=1695218 RepID=UPI00119FEEBD|nr:MULTISPECIES: hypothetical protein [Paenibacillaceae]
MKVRTILIGLAMAVTLTGCSTQAATLDSGMPNQSPANQSTNVDNSINSDTVQISSEQDRGTDSSAQLKKEEKKVLMEPITLYEVDSKEFAKKTSEIPSYYKGEISYVTQAEMESFNEGHSVTLGSPLERTIMGISNLIPNEYLPDPSIDQQLAKEQGGTHLDKTVKITTAGGIVFTKNPYNKETESTIVDVQVPEWGTYSVTWKTGQGSGIELIQKIVFTKAENFNVELVAKPLLLYAISEDLLKKDVLKIPYYGIGTLGHVTNEEIQSINEGHSPWKATPLLTAEFMTANLVPKHVDPKEVSYRVVRVEHENQENELTIVEAQVPSCGIYTIALNNAGKDNNTISFITRIEFKPTS